MYRNRLFACLFLPIMLAACEAPPGTVVRTPLPHSGPPVVSAEPGPSAKQAAQNFIAVAADMEPRIERECRARTRGRNCDYQVMVDDRPDSTPNALQTVDRRGRPVVAFNLALIAEARNRDELAFVMGHEAAHYILGHLEAKSTDANRGALIMGALAAASGGDESTIQQAQDFGAELGARRYSKDYELQADKLGTIIAWNAGYDPAHGALFFTRLADPGHSFLGTHPSNAERIALVRRTVAQLRAGAKSGSGI
ncbi:peptidase M48-like protein [Rhodobacter aestuarii]|uniref:Peptidase family M48 n=1 Tax=Rhodobacter aestuarii TaxID=453582 RepID=A0A1N7NAF7_9RHOB|nr:MULTISPECIES: M48 family metalloprotease [Rhodobacter]PTV96339.1 peptidase M48-like protein [Rhodobacter aestuarii]SIS95344.1 Peptidase family M48 [Rhodobacter aestuarii]SOB92793.1 peptidase M48-like protein [Rhodobacter sp. JA431]